MAFTITWLGHAGFSMNIDGISVLVDPFLTDNPSAAASADEIEADYILVSHGHGDHIGDTIAIAKRTGATVISNAEICRWLGKQGLDNVHAQHIGGGFNHEFGYVKLTIAHHGSILPDGSYGGNPAGFLITTNRGKTAYFACDTGLFYEMKFYGEEGIDVAFLPIGDNYTMGPNDALRAVKLLEPKVVIPMHYNTWELIRQDATAWIEAVRNETTSTPVLLNPGDTYTVD
jgi:L-ascorbate metabolism protein UlaG (beta-lactamase superfamily)